MDDPAFTRSGAERKTWAGRGGSTTPSCGNTDAEPAALQGLLHAGVPAATCRALWTSLSGLPIPAPSDGDGPAPLVDIDSLQAAVEAAVAAKATTVAAVGRAATSGVATPAPAGGG
jgi:hypothetical protein